MRQIVFEEEGAAINRGTLFYYLGLVAWDSHGHRLAAAMARLGGLGLRVNDRNATYPATIDPMVVNETTKLVASEGGCRPLPPHPCPLPPRWANVS